jgi:hypothetical protein
VQLLKNFPAFYGTRRFITVFTRALHWSGSYEYVYEFSGFINVREFLDQLNNC